jgi:hypothetical protein
LENTSNVGILLKGGKFLGVSYVIYPRLSTSDHPCISGGPSSELLRGIGPDIRGGLIALGEIGHIYVRCFKGELESSAIETNTSLKPHNSS